MIFDLIISKIVCDGPTFHPNRIGGVMVSVLASSAVGRGFELRSVKPKTIKLVVVASPLRTYYRSGLVYSSANF